MKRALIAILVLSIIFVCVSCSSNDDKKVIDVSKYSTTMAYSTLDNMLNINPSEYLGKTIKIGGVFVRGMNNYTNTPLDFIVITDSTACCSLGLEFELAGNLAYPNDYPEEGTDAIIEGLYESYEENGAIYYHLTEAKFV